MTGHTADVRAYYAALGVTLPDRTAIELSIRCFANPESHARHDRRPSCSVNAMSGAWKCNGCGAKGGAYDAAIALGHSPRSAIDLMIAHRLTTRRTPSDDSRRRRNGGGASAAFLSRPVTGSPPRRLRAPARLPRLEVTDRDVLRWTQALREHPPALRYLSEKRGWSPTTVLSLQVGLAGDRVAIPIRDEAGALVGVQRYKPRRSADEPKALNVPGTANGLFPHPSTERASRLILVEGPPDALAARSRRLPAVALPGVHSWQREWSLLFAGRSVSVTLDCDDEGRAAAHRIARDLCGVALDVEVLDLDPDRRDGFDLTDWLLAQPGAVVPLAQLRASVTTVPVVTGASTTD